MRYHDVGKNRFLYAAASLQKPHQKLPRQQVDLLANQLSCQRDCHTREAAEGGSETFCDAFKITSYQERSLG